ncbi:Eukaryotic aspartyl protease family protein, partial [Prunus dulcis]
ITYFNPGEENKASTLKVVHKHGPCSELNQIQKENTPNHTQILDRDQAGVKSIHSRLGSKKMNSDGATTMPVHSGDIVSSGDYIVTVGLGTPQKQLSLIFDTGSDLSWTQCRPCIGSCYKQMEPLFDPSISTSYVNISCKSNVCSQLTPVTHKIPRCSTDNSTCIYDMQYGDKSFSVGFFGKERLTLTSTEVFDEFIFGCGQINQGNFGSSAGLDFGATTSPSSNKQPTSMAAFSFIVYPPLQAPPHVKFTPLTTVSQDPSFYGLNLVGISVGGHKLWISPSVFLSSGTIIDKGTVITRLPAAAYSALRDALSVLDTCYDLSKLCDSEVSTHSILLSGRAESWSWMLRNKASTLKVVHKHGPCSELNQIQKENTPNHTQILDRDQAGVKSIHSRLGSKKMNSDGATTMPVHSGDIVSSGDYIVTVGLGTPQKQLSLIFDTGSDLSWTQCRPCIGSCYKQMEPLFDPSISTSYVNISCKSNVCSQLTPVTHKIPRCSTDNSTCIYDMQYGDKSFSVGFFGKERLTLTSTEVFDEFIFGCGQINQGNFGSSAGLDFGATTSPSSNKQPTSMAAFSFIVYPPLQAPPHVKFTPLTTVSQDPSFYGLNLVGISVGGHKLWISPSVFLSSGTIIDKGTVITRLPAAAYSALRDVFRQAMTKYPLTQALSVLDTCYDLSSYVTVKYPHIAFYFQGGLKLELDATVLGNVQQKTFEVVYDFAGGGLDLPVEVAFENACMQQARSPNYVQLYWQYRTTICETSEQ